MLRQYAMAENGQWSSMKTGAASGSLVSAKIISIKPPDSHAPAVPAQVVPEGQAQEVGPEDQEESRPEGHFLSLRQRPHVEPMKPWPQM